MLLDFNCRKLIGIQPVVLYDRMCRRDIDGFESVRGFLSWLLLRCSSQRVVETIICTIDRTISKPWWKHIEMFCETLSFGKAVRYRKSTVILMIIQSYLALMNAVVVE